MKTYAAATRLLVTALGRQVVLVDDETRKGASFDSSKILFDCEAVIRPRSSKHITKVLELANKHRVPVTCRGRGTSLTGSAGPIRGGWVLDMLAWNKVEIDPEAGLAFVEAGATVESIQKAAEEKGWFYPPDPSSKQYSTIGGNIACNAGGMHGGKYGVTRDFVLALKGHLPTGEHVTWGTPTKKFSAGFNLRDLWIGSEGMLGVITEAVLKLVPKPEARWTILCSYHDEPDAFVEVRKLFAMRIQPAICEFLDRYSVLCAERATGQSVFEGQSGRPVLLIELAGSPSEVADQSKQVTEWAQKGAVAFRVAQSREEAEQLWSVRRKCSGAMFELGDSKLNEDIVVPLKNYSRFATFLEGLRKTSKLPIPTFGHLADGNLHVNIMYHRDSARERKAAEKAVASLMKTVVALGGSISGEHGIGLAKTPFLRIQHSPAQVKAMMAVKKALDPNGVLNPGKMFTVYEVWKAPRMTIHLPWDHK